MKLLKEITNKKHKHIFGGLDVLKYIGPGFLVTAGFIDPGNWASNMAAGSYFGYSLLWVVTLSTLMLIILQHNVAHLGIVSGLCLSEAINRYFNKFFARFIIFISVIGSISTSLAEILGSAIALNILFKVPIKIGSVLIAFIVIYLIFSNKYQRIEKIIIAFVSLIGLSFIYELFLVDVKWTSVLRSSFIPSIPDNSSVIILSILGAVIMPHNLFLHSEVIQSRQWNLEEKSIIERQLKYEFFDTLLSMVIGWAINSSMIILAASVFWNKGFYVDKLEDAAEMLVPLLGKLAGIVFSIALLLSGLSSAITSGIAGASIFAGMYNEPMNFKDIHSKIGTFISIIGAVCVIMFIRDPFKILIYSQAILGMVLPFVIFSQIILTSSKRVMNEYVNSKLTVFVLTLIGLVITYFNIKVIFL